MVRPTGQVRRSLRSYFELVRIFLTPTAVGDSFTGFVLACLVEPQIASPARSLLPVVCAASILAYWLGMASNDLFDVRKDRVHAPEKPLASGRVPAWSAIVLSCLLALGFLVAGVYLEITPVAVALLLFILAYNGGGKKIPLVGNLIMGGARSANLMLGAAAALGVVPSLRRPELTSAAALLGLYIVGVTAVSVLEDRPFARGRFLLSSASILAIPIVFVVLAPTSALAWLNSLVLIVLLAEAMLSSSRASEALRHGHGSLHPAALFVRKALGGIFFVDAGCLVAFAPDGDAAVMEVATLYMLFVVTRVWTRRWVRAGSMGS